MASSPALVSIYGAPFPPGGWGERQRRREIFTSAGAGPNLLSVCEGIPLLDLCSMLYVLCSMLYTLYSISFREKRAALFLLYTLYTIYTLNLNLNINLYLNVFKREGGGPLYTLYSL